jgi:uncharacterized protein YdaU (DUF1376 family)
MSTSGQAFMPLFFGDFLASTAEWSGEEQALYLLLLGHQWSLGSLPADLDRLARLSKWDRALFDRCWATVASKFDVADGRLYNATLERHREKSRAISAKRSKAGTDGAASRWKGKPGDKPSGNPPDNKMANASRLPIAPYHPIPSQSNPTEGAGCGSEIAPTGAPEKPAVSVPRGTAFETLARIRLEYPAGTYNDSSWMLVERLLDALLDGGATPDELVDAARRYCAQQAAMGKVRSQYVKSPANFYDGSGYWRSAFPLPAPPASAVADRLAAGNEAAWARIRSHASAIACPLVAGAHEAPESFEGRVRQWERDEAWKSAKVTPGPRRVRPAVAR